MQVAKAGRPLTLAVSALAFAWGCSLIRDTDGLVGLGDASGLVDAEASPGIDSSGLDAGEADIETDASPAKGLIGEWRFDDGTATDTSGRGNHGRFVGAATVSLDAGRRGGALVIGAPTDGVIVDSLALSAFPASGTLTMTLWSDGPVDAGTPSIFDGFSTGRAHLFWRQRAGPSNEVQFALQAAEVPDGASAYAWLANYALPTATWTHLTMTWDTVAGEVVLFVNRAEAARDSITLPFSPTGQLVSIGGMKGRYDDVRLYDRVLSGAEVATLP